MKKLILIVALAGNLAHIATIQASGAGEKGNVEVRKKVKPEQALDMLKTFYKAQPLNQRSRKQLSKLLKNYLMSHAFLLIKESTATFEEDEFNDASIKLSYKYLNPKIIALKKSLQEERVDPTSIRKMLYSIRENLKEPTISEIITEMAILEKFKQLVDMDITTKVPTTIMLPVTGPPTLHETVDEEMGIVK